MAQNLQILFQTRYSFFGKSGWRSAPSRDKAQLFDPGRLARRFSLFEKMALASLRDQTDTGFKLVVLTAQDLPPDHARLLREACHDVLGPERAHIIARPEGSAGAWLQKYTARKLNDAPHSVQIVLDDDDAVSADFVEVARAEAAFALSRFRPEQDCVYLSFASGLTARFSDDGVDLIRRDVAFTNLGLSLVAPTTTRRNPYMLAHKKVARRHPVRVIHDQRPYYIRAIHGMNDSRAHHGDDVLDAAAVRAARAYFPLLGALELTAEKGAAAA